MAEGSIARGTATGTTEGTWTLWLGRGWGLGLDCVGGTQAKITAQTEIRGVAPGRRRALEGPL